MKKTYSIITFILSCAITFGQQYDLQWAKSYGGIELEWFRDLDVDLSNNIYSVGYFDDSSNFENYPNQHWIYSPTHSTSYIRKCASNGDFLWAHAFGTTGSNDMRAVCTDQDQNVIVAGRYSNTIDADPGPGVFTLSTGTPGIDAYLLKLDSNGDFIWAIQIGQASSVYINSIVSDTSNNLLITGAFSNTVDFDPGPGVQTMTSTSVNASDIFVAKYDENGSLLWVKNVGGTGVDEGNDIYRGHDGSIYITGSFSGVADMDPSSSILNITSAGSYDAFVMKLSSTGDLIWAKGVGGIENDIGYSVSADTLGNAYYTGYFRATADFNPGTGTNLVTSAGFFDIFIQRVNSNGSIGWTRTEGSNGSDIPEEIVVTQNGNVYVSGAFQTTVDFDPGPGVSSFTSSGSHDIFLQKFDTTGNMLFTKQIGGTNPDYAQGMTVDNNGDIILGGQYRMTVDFDPGAGVVPYSSQGNYDCFLLNLEGCFETSTVVNIQACDSFQWVNNTLYSEPGYYSDSILLFSQEGCDSLVYLNLTLNNSSSITEQVETCDSYTWINNVTYSQPGNYLDTMFYTNQGGCDSLVILDLILNNSSDYTEIVESCDSFKWVNGITYYSNIDTVTASYVNQHGCDSIVTLDLTILPSTSSVISDTALDVYTLNGIDYTVSGTYTQVLQNSNGCDSTITLELVVEYTGIDKLETVPISIYPNPVNDQLHVDLGIRSDIDLTIWSTKGELIKTNRFHQEESVKINTRELPMGIYLLQIKTEGQQSWHRFVKE